MLMFGFVAGAVLTFAGIHVTDKPITFLSCLTALLAAHHFLP